MTRAASAAGAPAPAVFDEVTVEERFGVVLERLDGPTLSQLSRDNAVTREETGAVLASLATAVHRTPPPPEAPLLSVSLADQLQRAAGLLPSPITSGVLDLIGRLPAQDGFCHGDLHPANVIMTAAGPRLIDWGGATRAPAGLDLACCHVVLTQLAAETADDPERPRGIDAAFQSEYARLAGRSPAALTAAIAPYLAIARTRALVGPVGSQALREEMIRQVEAALRAS